MNKGQVIKSVWVCMAWDNRPVPIEIAAADTLDEAVDTISAWDNYDHYVVQLVKVYDVGEVESMTVTDVIADRIFDRWYDRASSGLEDLDDLDRHPLIEWKALQAAEDLREEWEDWEATKRALRAELY